MCVSVSNGFRAISVRPAHREGRLRSTSELAYRALQAAGSILSSISLRSTVAPRTCYMRVVDHLDLIIGFYKPTLPLDEPRTTLPLSQTLYSETMCYWLPDLRGTLVSLIVSRVLEFEGNAPSPCTALLEGSRSDSFHHQWQVQSSI